MVQSKKDVKRIKRKKSKSDLTIHFMPYSEIATKDSISRVKLLMGLVLDNKLIVLQGKLKVDEEARLIENSMMLIGNIKGFRGIEIATIGNGVDGENLFHKIRYNIARILVGEQDAMTIIGPASVVKEMKKDPSKIEVLLQK